MDFNSMITVSLLLSAMLFSVATCKVLRTNSLIGSDDRLSTFEIISNILAADPLSDHGNVHTVDNHVPSIRKEPNFEDAVEDMNKSLKENEEICTLFDPPSPNFKVPGRRISETKCLEHIWEVKKQEETENRVKQCMARHTDFTTIVGGRDAEPGEFPHMGALGWKSKKGDWAFLCGSFLISDKFVLTAAHCQSTDDLTVAHPKPKIVRFGVENIIKDQDRSPVDIKILKFIRHPKYKPYPHKSFDVAVVELAKRVSFDKFIQPACILKQNLEKAVVTGWGVIDSVLYSTNTSDELQVAEVDIVPSEICHKKLRRKIDRTIWKKVQNHQICATKLHGSADTCQGDSGGPLQAKLSVGTEQSIYNVVGVTSFGFICGREMFPSIYTKVSSFIDWIESIVWSAEKRELRSLYIDNSSEDKNVNVNSVRHYSGADLYVFDKTGGKWSYVIH